MTDNSRYGEKAKSRAVEVMAILKIVARHRYSKLFLQDDESNLSCSVHAACINFISKDRTRLICWGNNQRIKGTRDYTRRL